MRRLLLLAAIAATPAFAQDVPHAGIPSIVGECVGADYKTPMPCPATTATHPVGIIDPLATRDVKVTLGQVREIQMALASIETRDGKPVPTCLGDVKPPCIPLAISSAIADDLAALSPHWQFYQAQAHKLIGDASGGTGYLAPGSKEETVANFRLFDLNGQPVTVRVRPVDVNGLEASGVQVPPTIKAVLAPISR